jgi:hypothetical protein
VNPELLRVIAASDKERRDLFLAAGRRVGTTGQNVEKDFWVCWTLDALFNGLKPGGPRLLFKGGTSLSKAYGLIERFSEDIDVTVFRQDIGVPAEVEELIELSGKKRSARLDAIKDACRTYIQGPLLEQLAAISQRTMRETGNRVELRITVDDADQLGQSLLVWYSSVTTDGNSYVQPAVKIESGARSALDPHVAMTLKPYVAEEIAGADLSIPNVTTIRAARTFWDKVIILHGLRSWYERRAELRGQGQRVSRHYYDLYRLFLSDIADQAISDTAMAEDCVNHARIFFNHRDYDLGTATVGTFVLTPHAEMIADLRRDYAAMSIMIFGEIPNFQRVMETIDRIEKMVNVGRAG